MKILLNFPYYFDTRSSMGVFYKDLYDALSAAGAEVYTASLAVPVEIPVSSYVTPTGKRGGKLRRFVTYYARLIEFMRHNPDAILLNVSQEFAFTPCPRRTIVIVHDLIQLSHPRTWWIKSYIRLMLPFIRRCGLAIAVSQTTRQQLLGHGIQSRVAYNWFAAVDLLENEKEYSKDYDGIFIGNHLVHKRMELFLDLVRARPQYRFAAIVPEAAASLLAAEGAPRNLEIQSRCSRAEYVELLRRTKILVSTSVAEGFGRPPMEALLAGASIVVSDLPIYREIYGDVAAFFRPDDLASLIEVFERVRQSGTSGDASARSRHIQSCLGSTAEYVRLIEEFGRSRGGE
jgi:glycosyltransferase involved in cell wall biosynthesis